MNKILWIVLLLCPMLATASCIGLGCSCSVTASPVAFGGYNPLQATPTDNSGLVSVTCSALVVNALVSYTVDLSTGASGSYATRTLIKGSDHLDYNLYTTNAYNIIWGNGSGGSSNISTSYLIALFSRTDDYTVYGRLPASQYVATGVYNDTITVTVTY